MLILMLSGGEETSRRFSLKTGIKAVPGGVEQQLSDTHSYDNAIVATGIDELPHVCALLLSKNVRRILLEKPGALDIPTLKSLARQMHQKNAEVYIGYNRRFYSSVLRAKQLIENDGGVSSVICEFTEVERTLDVESRSQSVLDNWIISNSSHVIDLMIYFAGYPEDFKIWRSGHKHWHSTGSAFSSSGSTETGCLFSCFANWGGPGRWSLEVITSMHRLIFRPLETLQIQKIGEFNISDVNEPSSVDTEFKPGIFLQTQKFLSSETQDFCSINEQSRNLHFYNALGNYVDLGSKN